MKRWAALNTRQHTLLNQISEAATAVAREVAHPRTMSALRDRGLIRAQRTSTGWDAWLTESGRFYRDHGHHPDHPAYHDHRLLAKSADGHNPVVWDGEPLEHDGMLWKPGSDTTVTFDEFVSARTTVVEILGHTIWNPWIREEREPELRAAMTVFGQWDRAEPGFHQWDEDEAIAWLDQERAESSARGEREDQQRLARIPHYDQARDEARLKLLEYDGRPYLPIEPDALDDLRRLVGDPETVIDRHGWLPAERRRLTRVGFSCWRHTEVRRRRSLIADLRAKYDASTDRAERGELRATIAREDQARQEHEIIPEPDVANMCADCDRPSSWHHSRSNVLPQGHCYAWPQYLDECRQTVELLRQLAANRKKPEPPKPKPLAVIPSGLSIDQIMSRLATLKAQHPDATVRRGNANKWELWPPRNEK
ncbi:hypothetical protein [Amycolatopsis sp. cmx-11-32]|uniref:hypothetical protein n=1 Tax=Amycolatopsis sp. cmx-11-32 TaxID=2785796 RepID=UPI0039E286D6